MSRPTPAPTLRDALDRETVFRLAGSSAFERGERIVERGRVVALEATEREITATVSGTAEYAVTIGVDDDGHLASSCDCPSGWRAALCKHAVAAALVWLGERPAQGEE